MVSYDFTNFVKTYGGTAAFEFQPSSNFYASILAYDYRQTEDQTDPIFTLRAFDQLKNQTAHGGTLRVPDVRTALNYDRFETESRGVLFKTRYTDDIYDVARKKQIDGVTYTVFQPMNAQSSRLRGLELNLIQNRLPLPGGRLGASVNTMRTWGSMDYVANGQVRHLDRLLFQRDWIANAALFYALPRGGELRLAYNYRSSYYDGIGEHPWQDRGPEASDGVGLTLRYRVARDWIVKLQALNLAGQGLRLGYGEDLRYRRAELTPTRSFFFNIVYKPR
jgi:outer membrane receptor protein involved in Fe transport